jgi:hypothetical protein
VTTTCRPGARCSRSATTPAASRSCSRLSSTSSSSRPARWSASSSSGSRGTARETPSAAARLATTTSAASSGRAGTVPTNDTNAVPSRWRPPLPAATSTASRVLPIPPGPTRVTSRQAGSSSSSCSLASSRSRPTRVVGGCGRSRPGRAAGPGRWGAAGPGTPSSVNPPALAISSRRVRVAAAGSSPSSSRSTYRQVSNWARAALRWPPMARNHISARWASSCSGSSSSMRRATSTPAAGSSRSRDSVSARSIRASMSARQAARRATSQSSNSGAPGTSKPWRNSPRHSRTAANSSSPPCSAAARRATSTASTQTGWPGASATVCLSTSRCPGSARRSFVRTSRRLARAVASGRSLHSIPATADRACAPPVTAR